MARGNPHPTKGFQPGNAGGPGNPFAAQVNKLRARLYAACTPERIDGVAKVLIREALKGEGWAVKELFDRLFGKSTQAVALEGDGLKLNLEQIAAAIEKIVSKSTDADKD